MRRTGRWIAGLAAAVVLACGVGARAGGGTGGAAAGSGGEGGGGGGGGGAAGRAGGAARGTPVQEIAGRIVVTGAEPRPWVILLPADTGAAEGGGAGGEAGAGAAGAARGGVRLVGPLEGELRRLGGATVRVRGQPVGEATRGRLEVRSYQVLSIDGQVPVVGILTLRGGEPWVLGADTVRLEGGPPELRALGGAKVWVVGPRRGAALEVQSYGVLAAPGAPSP